MPLATSVALGAEQALHLAASLREAALLEHAIELQESPFPAMAKLSCTYSYPWGAPPGCCGSGDKRFYDDPDHTILTDGDVGGHGGPQQIITSTNAVEWTSQGYGYDHNPVFDLVTAADISKCSGEPCRTAALAIIKCPPEPAPL